MELKGKWLDEYCNSCGRQISTWDKRISKVLAYKYPCCEDCIAKEYDMEPEDLRRRMENVFCPVLPIGRMPQLLSGIAGQEDDPVNCNEIEKEEQIGHEKFWALLCMVIVIFSMAACGNIQAQTPIDQAESPMEEGTPLSGLSEESENADVQSEAMDSTETKAEGMQPDTISNESENMTESAADTGDGETVPETEMSETAGTEADIQNGAEEAAMNMKVQVGDAVFSATLEENEAVASFVEMMRKNPVSIQMSDYSGFEKVGSLGTSIPINNSQTTTHAGDIVLYNGNQIVIFYGSNSWSYTRLGHVDDLTGWEEALGSGDVTVTFSLE